MFKQREHRVPDQAHRRLVPGDDQQHDHAEELLLAQRVATLFDLKQSADEIVAGGGAPALEELTKVRDELVDRRAELLDVLWRQYWRDHRVRPAPEPVAIGDGYAEQLGDDCDRQWEGELVDEIHLAARLDRVDQLVGDLLDTRAQLL